MTYSHGRKSRGQPRSQGRAGSEKEIHRALKLRVSQTPYLHLNKHARLLKGGVLISDSGCTTPLSTVLEPKTVPTFRPRYIASTRSQGFARRSYASFPLLSSQHWTGAVANLFSCSSKITQSFRTTDQTQCADKESLRRIQARHMW